MWEFWRQYPAAGSTGGGVHAEGAHARGARGHGHKVGGHHRVRAFEEQGLVVQLAACPPRWQHTQQQVNLQAPRKNDGDGILGTSNPDGLVLEDRGFDPPDVKSRRPPAGEYRVVVQTC